MARVTLNEWPVGFTESDYYLGSPVSLYAKDTHSMTSYQYLHGVTLIDVPVHRIDEYTAHIGDYYFKAPSIYLAPDYNDAGLAEMLPPGWTVTRDMDWRVNAYRPIITIDVEYWRKSILGHYRDARPWFEPEGDTWDQVLGYTFSRWWREVRTSSIRRISLMVDIASSDDLDIQITTYGSTDFRFSMPVLRGYDSTRPHLRYTHMTGSPSSEDTSIRMLYAKLLNEYDAVNKYELDDNLITKHMRLVEQGAFGLGMDDGPRRKRTHDVTPGRRALVLDVEDRVPFPRECFFGNNRQKALCLKAEWGSDKLANLDGTDPSNLFRNSHVLIHKQGGTTRFIFTEIVKVWFGITRPSVIGIMFPLHVTDAECSESAPLVAWRGLSRQMTLAINGNPFFASALQHAMNRRKYLASIVDPTNLKMHYPKKPILIRSMGGKHPLMPSAHTRLGRKAARENLNMFTTTIDNLMHGLYENELLATEPTMDVQPVASDKRERRAIVLDS